MYSRRKWEKIRKCDEDSKKKAFESISEYVRIVLGVCICLSGAQLIIIGDILASLGTSFSSTMALTADINYFTNCIRNEQEGSFFYTCSFCFRPLIRLPISSVRWFNVHLTNRKRTLIFAGIWSATFIYPEYFIGTFIRSIRIGNTHKKNTTKYTRMLKNYNWHSGKCPLRCQRWICFCSLYVAYIYKFNSSYSIYFRIYIYGCLCVRITSPIVLNILLIPLFIVSFIFQYDAHALYADGPTQSSFEYPCDPFKLLTFDSRERQDIQNLKNISDKSWFFSSWYNLGFVFPG